ncbi:bifunctional glutamate N-acetyltransferase/amino-acid acetyltransferase ArgJ [Kingella kingae]|nr:bifunctional glutamate N-acetyltransferase/amino-acid acetyltransferase ArgJ [Kingella kingae]MDK4527565.1 bifunctional glutamate N-acetyltransferase/amino-acid acetyltransferase ArgJ [Kingella kingae]MDK4534685.1 bifunctional glutamate N-acetyltransferase/amino-acid acetyltransferase ArgJ [Kingella kingae]MDK4541150.1 bifunctional glutamate N-acetyltransferase/amino-acid acetyltransferase ArgJ [Kingella kingae]MDK4543195.1 bifunctional glutamate N-acetyltransferase/amino-acid acetyltransfer
MAVNLTEKSPDQLRLIDGVQLFTAQAGIKKAQHDDVTLMLLSPESTVAAVFTQNKFCAAPVRVAKRHLFNENGIRALIINTGNANAGTGASGEQHALQMCAAAAKSAGCLLEQVLPFSTGVILEPLPIQKIVDALLKIRQVDWGLAARAIMTTDTVAKAASAEARVGNHHTVRATGISKGAGMICPNMATMLGFIATDANIAQPILQQMTEDIANETFNCITVDGDTSTNDSFVIIATGKCGQNEIDNIADPRYQQVYDLLKQVALELAQAIVRDGEGATKFITVRVENASSLHNARKIAYAIAHSPLVKTAFSASDPNLGRILAAIGYSGEAVDVDKLRLYLGDVLVAEQGGRAASYQEADGQRVMNEAEILVRVDVNAGTHHATVYTCDLTKEYVAINADYRS